MKKIILLIILIIVLCTIGFVIYKIKIKSELNTDFGRNLFDGKYPKNGIVIINDFSITKRMDSVKRNNSDIILVLFNPECEICYNEILGFTKNKKLFENYQVVLASTAESKVILSYINKFDLTGFAHLAVGTLKSNSLGRSIIPYPSVLVYDANGFFLRGFKGSVEIDKIVSRF
jgi:hypothetical protein